MVSIFTFLPDYSTDKVEPETAPRVAMGAASPLWLMFGGAAAAGAAYWWWASRWREAVNLEAILGYAAAPTVETAPEALPEPVIAPALEAAAEPVVEAAELVLDAAQEIIEITAEPVVEAVVAANEDVAEAVVETAAVVEPATVDVVEAVAEVAETPAEPVVERKAAETVQETVVATLDDLTRIVGVGPKLAASLADLGVTTFSQIAAWTPDELTSYDELLNLRGRADRDAWIAQAKRFAE